MKTYDFRSEELIGNRLTFEIVLDSHPYGTSAEEAAYRYATVHEAAAVYEHVQIDRPFRPIALRAFRRGQAMDLILRHAGENVLITDYRTAEGWNDPEVQWAVGSLIRRLDIGWQMDRDLVGTPILIPYESPHQAPDCLLRYFELDPRDPDDPLSSIEGVVLDDRLFDVSLDTLKGLSDMYAKGGECPKVRTFIVDCRDASTDERHPWHAKPLDLRILRNRHVLRREQEREGEVGREPLDSAVQEAKDRAAGRNLVHLANEKESHSHGMEL